MTQSETKTVVP